MQEQQKGLFISTPQEIEPQVDHEEKREKITIYLRSDHIRKLDSLVYEHNCKTRGKRINRNHVVRYLIDQCTVEALKDLHRAD